VDRDPAHVVAHQLHLAGVQAAADLDPDPLHGGADGAGAAQRPLGGVEGGQEPVAGHVQLAALVAGDLAAGEGVVGLQQLAPAAVAELGRALGRAHDVGEQDGRKPTLGPHGRPSAFLELGTSSGLGRAAVRGRDSAGAMAGTTKQMSRRITGTAVPGARSWSSSRASVVIWRTRQDAAR
jgi:hypothetical protein